MLEIVLRCIRYEETDLTMAKFTSTAHPLRRTLSSSLKVTLYLPTLSLVQNQPSVTTLGPTVSLVSTVSAPCTALTHLDSLPTTIGTADAELLLVFKQVKVDVSSGMGGRMMSRHSKIVYCRHCTDLETGLSRSGLVSCILRVKESRAAAQ
jgi:hypothetical protein